MSDPTQRRYSYDERTVERFWSKVHKTPTCWLWTAGTDSSGYGQFRIRDGSRHVHARAHRIAFDLEVGLPTDTDLILDHICRVRNCVNPAHLRLVTQQANILAGTGQAALNSAKTECPHGHAYDDENTHVDAQGRRHCRECKRQRQKGRRRPKSVCGLCGAEVTQLGRHTRSVHREDQP